MLQATVETLKRKAASALIEEELTHSRLNKAVSRKTRAEDGIRSLRAPNIEVDDLAALSEAESAQFFETRAATLTQIKKLQSDVETAGTVADRCLKQLALQKKAATEREYFVSSLQGLVSAPGVSTIKTCTVCLTGTSNLAAVECPNLHATCFECISHRLSQHASFPPEEAAAVCCSNPVCGAGLSLVAVCRAVAGQPAAIGYLRKAAEVQATAASFRQASEEMRTQRELDVCTFARRKLEDALVLRCPTPGCDVMFSIEEHDECYALECSGCKLAFCGICLVSLADVTNASEGL